MPRSSYFGWTFWFDLCNGKEAILKVTTIAVPLGAALGLLLALLFLPSSSGILAGTLVGGMLGGFAGLRIAEWRNKSVSKE